MANEFLTDLFGDQEGIVYSPVKDGGWKQYFFEWPAEQDKLEKHIEDYDQRDVYISPVLFSEKRIAPETFRGTNYLWTEFDGTVPSEAIEPSMRVMSSQEGHEHWYWKLDEFVTDKVVLEDYTRRIAYHYGADLSVWDYQNVLRPVDTWNHKRNKPVTLLSKSDSVYPIERFSWLPIPAAGTKIDIALGSLPSRDEVLAKYKWKLDTLDLLFKIVDTGGRSTALTRLAFDAIEAGCSNEEAYVLLENRDTAWGKYVGRTDRDKQLKACISYARSKKVIVAEIVQGTTEVYRYKDFMQTTIKMKWVIEGLLPVAGSMLIEGKEGIGKSTFALRMAMSIALGDGYFINWKIVNRQRTLFVSLEMPHDELKSFFEDMALSPDRESALQDWFYVWPIGHAYPLDTPDQQIELLKFIDLHKIELVIIDSLSLSMYGSINDNETIKRLNGFLNEDVRKERRCGYAFIHHLRKRGSDSEGKDDLDESYGSRFITANAQSVVLLKQKPGSAKLVIKLMKTRHAVGSREIEVERTPDRGFKLVGGNLEIESSTAERGEASTNQERKNPNLGKLFGL